MSTVTKPILKDETGVRIAQAIEDLQAIGRPTSEQVELAVGEYLNDHPELVTTVDFSIATKVFGTVADMLADNTLKAGDNVATRAYYAAGDNGGNNYVISAAHTGVFYLTLNNGLYANLLTEKGVLRAESIGIKAYAAATDNPDSTDMSRNVTLFNTAHYNGIYILFGIGHYYFSSELLLSRYRSHKVMGIDRERSILHFPNSNGLYFCDPEYYNYYVIKNIQIRSYGHCIVCDESCLTVLDSHFEWLQLVSEHGDGFHGPKYNVAKYTSQDGERTVYDTCVQNCVFDFVNVQAHEGAGIANVMGMYSYYMHFNFISCKYAFRNCDGTLIQANTLSNTPGVPEDYFIYYDKAYSHALKWLFIDVNAEGIGKAFIYTEPAVAVPEGEDPKKPETANIMTLSRLVAINSGWSLTGLVESDHDVYPITVQRIREIELINSDYIISPSAYPSKYDTETVKGVLNIRGATLPKSYNGGPSVNILSGAYVYKLRGSLVRDRMTPSQAHSVSNTDVPPAFDMIYANRIYGGKATQIWNFKVSEYGESSNINPPIETYQFADIVVINNDTANRRSFSTLFNQMGITVPGRIVTVVNSADSLSDVHLRHPSVAGIATGGFAAFNGSGITLDPGTCVHLISTYYTYNNYKYVAWRVIDFSETEASIINVSGATPSIVGVNNTTYFCSTVNTLSITPPVDGSIEVFFTTGSNGTVLTMPRSVYIPYGIDPSGLDANAKYRVRITNATYGEIEKFVRQPAVNLLDPETFVDNKVWYNGNQVGGYNDYCATPKVAVEPGVTYLLERDSGGQGYVCMFDENEDYVSQTAWDNNATKTIADGVYYVGISMLKTDKENASLKEY